MIKIMITLKNKTLRILYGTILTILLSICLSYVRFITASEQVVNIPENINRLSLALIMPLLVSPIIEEYVFRKWITNLLTKKNTFIFSIIISNLLFSILHLDPFFIPYFVNGLIYSYFYKKTDDIKVPILIHILYNSFVFIATS